MTVANVFSQYLHADSRYRIRFVDQLHYAMLSGALNLKDWRICDRFVFAKRSESYALYLLVDPKLAQELFCTRSAPRIGQSGDVDLSRLDSGTR